MTGPVLRAPNAGDVVSRDLPDLTAVIAQATARYPFKRWGFGESIAIEALLQAGGEPGRVAAGLVVDWARHHAPLARDPLAHVAPGVPLLILAERESDRAEALLRCAHELAAVLARSVVGRHGAQIHRPDLDGWEHEVWVDCMHLDGPFLSHLARLTGAPDYADLAGDVLLGHARVLQDERSGLFSHGFDDATGRANGVHWGRGQGWALLGLVDTAANLPDRHPAQAEVRRRLVALMEGLAATEAEPGAWHTVVAGPETYVESSVGAFVALGAARAMRFGLLPPTWSALADRSWEATMARVSSDGLLRGVSDATPVGSNALHYAARERGSFPWGQGPALLAAVERLNRSDSAEEMRHG